MTDQQRHPTLEYLEPLAGEWVITATHRLLPDDEITGHATFEWLDGNRFLIWRMHYDHPDIPDSVAVIGCEDQEGADATVGGCTVNYFDARGVSRRYVIEAEPGTWRYWRDWPGFSQRFTGRFSDDGRTMSGVAELCEDGTAWMEDLPMTYRRVG
ncbi:MAG TPA: hypothetical protein VD767_12270 [Thermomicrobiales bacterium]|nr:hypothetical protein [Thermomicrobiales bacterium]